MNACIRIFILWVVVVVYRAGGETETLLKKPTAGVPWGWHATKTDHKGAGWNVASTQDKCSVCDVTIADQPTNWLRTDFINVKDAKMLNVKLTYNLLGCPPSVKPFCKHYFSIYMLQAEKALPGIDLNPLDKKVTYIEVDTIKSKDLPPPKKRKSYTYDGKIVTKARGIYLAFLDQGSCVSITSVLLSYKYCSEIGSILVKFSRTTAPVNDSYLVEQTGNCTDVNSINKVKLSGVCLSSGEWNITDGVRCLCKAGYEFVNGSEGNMQECRECLKGFYKSITDNTKCIQCPENSASNTGRTGCLCNDGFYKIIELAPCKALPKAPPNASVTTVQATYVHINWEPSPDAIKGSRLRYSVDCFRCKSSKYKECGGSCGPHVQYKPSKDNITSLTVRINGLASGSFFRFRVYTVSELNEQEKDRHKWKYVVIHAKTKEEVGSPTTKRPEGTGSLTIKKTRRTWFNKKTSSFCRWFFSSNK